MKLRLHASIPHAIDLQLKHQPRALYPHIQREVQIVELDPFGRRQAREQALRHRVQVRGERAHVDEALAEGIGRDVHVAGYQVVFDDERLAGPEVARVVERDGLGL